MAKAQTHTQNKQRKHSSTLPPPCRPTRGPICLNMTKFPFNRPLCITTSPAFRVTTLHSSSQKYTLGCSAIGSNFRVQLNALYHLQVNFIWPKMLNLHNLLISNQTINTSVWYLNWQPTVLRVCMKTVLFITLITFQITLSFKMTSC